MKTTSILVAIVMVTFQTITCFAETILGCGSSTNGFSPITGESCAENVPDRPFLQIWEPSGNVHWVAGSQQSVRFYAQGFDGQWADLTLQSLEGEYEYRYYSYLSSFPIKSDGEVAQSFKVRFGIQSGYYRLAIQSYNDYYGQVMAEGQGIVRISSAISFPQEGAVLKAGRAYRVRWAGQDKGADHFGVYLVGNFWPPIWLADVNSQRGYVGIKIPKNLPEGVYRIRLDGLYVEGTASDEFTVKSRRTKRTKPSPSPVVVTSPVPIVMKE